MSYFSPKIVSIVEAVTGVQFSHAIKKHADNEGTSLPVSPNTLRNLVEGKAKPQGRTLEKIFEDAIHHEPEIKPLIMQLLESTDEQKVNRDILIFAYRRICRVTADTKELGYMLAQLDKLIEIDDKLLEEGDICRSTRESQFHLLFPRQGVTEFGLRIWAGLFILSAFDTLFMSLRFMPKTVEYGVLGRGLRQIEGVPDSRNALVAAAWQSIQDDLLEYSDMSSVKEGLALEPTDNEPHKVAKALLRGSHKLNEITLRQTLKNLFSTKVQADIADISLLIAYGLKHGLRDSSQEDLSVLRCVLDCYPELLVYHKRSYQEWESRQ